MDLIIDNKIIEAPIVDIIQALREDTGNYYFNYIGKDGDKDIKVTCPYHKNGVENRSSAGIFNLKDDPEVEYGFFKCFTCGKKVPLYAVVSHCFDKDEKFGKEWLVDNFGSLLPIQKMIPPAFIQKKKEKVVVDREYIDESELNKFNYIHPYMYKRKLTNDVIAKFKIGYDKDTDSITFPCWDINGNLTSISRRSVSGKRFNLERDLKKDVYLLNFINPKVDNTVYVTESQINALTLWSYGLPAIALFGTGTEHQYDILNNYGIKHYVLCLDPDDAGRKGTIRLINNLKKCIIDIKDLPDGKDVNDLTQSEFNDARLLTSFEWVKKYHMKLLTN